MFTRQVFQRSPSAVSQGLILFEVITRHSRKALCAVPLRSHFFTTCVNVLHLCHYYEITQMHGCGLATQTKQALCLGSGRDSEPSSCSRKHADGDNCVPSRTPKGKHRTPASISCWILFMAAMFNLSCLSRWALATHSPLSSVLAEDWHLARTATKPPRSSLAPSPWQRLPVLLRLSRL